MNRTCWLRCGCRVAWSVLCITLIKKNKKLSSKWNETRTQLVYNAIYNSCKTRLFRCDVEHISKPIKCFDVHFACARFLFKLRWWTLSVTSIEWIAHVSPGWQTWKVTWKSVIGWMNEWFHISHFSLKESNLKSFSECNKRINELLQGFFTEIDVGRHR